MNIPPDYPHSYSVTHSPKRLLAVFLYSLMMNTYSNNKNRKKEGNVIYIFCILRQNGYR